MTWRKLGVLLMVVWIVLLAVVYRTVRDPWRDTARYSRALNDLESSSAGARKRALHEILDPVDYPLPDVKRQTRLAIGMMLGDEDENVRQLIALKLSGVAFNVVKSDPAAYRRIIVALSRSMAEDSISDCRYAAAYSLEGHVVGRDYVDRETGKLCEPYWKKAVADRNKDVADYAKTYLATIQGRLQAAK